MRKLLLLFCLFTGYYAHSQAYADYNIGTAFKPYGNNSPFMGMKFGYEFDYVFTTNGIVWVEYDQRALINGTSPTYFGGRVGYGLITGQYTSVVLLGGKYFRLASSDSKTDNNWIYGYGATFLWKSLSVDISKADFYQVSIGCRYTFE